MKKIVVVTHGNECLGRNPFMSARGVQQIKELEEFIKMKPKCVVAGNAFRYMCVADALGLTIDWHDSFFGDGGKIIEENGQLYKRYPDGARIKLEKDKTEMTKAKLARECLEALPPNTLVCAGRGLGVVLKLAGLYDEDFESASVYEILVDDRDIRIKKVNPELFSKAA